MTMIMAVGGSTNAVLHLLAIAKAAGVPLALDDFQRVSDRVPLLADLKPSGKYVQEDLHAVGGTPAVMKYLLERGFLHGDCMTVTGKTLAENLADAAPLEDRAADHSAARERRPAARPHPHPARQPRAGRRRSRRSPARRASASRAPRRSSTPKRRCSPGSRTGRDRQGRRGRDPLRRARRAAPACRRC